jgi:hypothetical protein
MIVGVFLVVAAVYLGWTLVPPYFANYQFEDAIQNEALFDSYTSKTEEDVRQAVFKKAQQLEIPIAPEQIQVKRGANNALAIWVDYSVHVDLPGYPMDLNFHSGSKNKPI